ncbi:MAG TPA: murein biosynthesis integral membrane protein MurJ [Phototrophicaceae bacterium]|nr:murein biosynthesis integral membrane protein MurJ [Phototrophicaceae bacterium]
MSISDQAISNSTARPIIRAASLIAVGNIASRGFGLAREVLKSYLFGSGKTVDAFNVAARVPLLLYDLLIGGMIHSSLVPVFSSYDDEHRADLWGLFSALFNLTAILIAGLVLLIELFAPQVARLMSGGSPDDVLALTADLMRIAVPALLFLSVGGVVSGLLYALRRFAWVALTLAVFNAVIVGGTLLLHERFGIQGMAISILLGGVVSLAIQLPGLRGTSYRLVLRHPDLGRVIALYIPIILGLLIDILISKPATYNLASQTGVGGIGWMDYATTLWQFPQGLVAVAVSFAVLPGLSASTGSGRQDEFQTTLIRGLNLIMVLIIPAAVAMFVLASPIVALVFQHGSFMAADTGMTSQVLRLDLLGLPFNAVDLLLVFAFYARQNTLTPALIGAVTSLLYVGLASVLVHNTGAGLFGIMIADALRIALHVLVCGWLLRGIVGNFNGIGRHLLQMMGAALVMGLAIYATLTGLDQLLSDQSGFISELLRVGIPALVGGAVYLGLLYRTQAGELIFGWIKKT